MGQFVLDIGNYYLQEKKTVYNGSGVFRTLYYSQFDDRNTDLAFLNLPDLEAEDFENVKDFINMLYSDLDLVEMKCDDAEIIEAEFKNSMRLILHGAKLGLFKLSGDHHTQRIKLIQDLFEDITLIINEYKRNWLTRNRSGGLEESTSKLESLKSQYKKALTQT